MKFNIYPLPICNCGATNSCIAWAWRAWVGISDRGRATPIMTPRTSSKKRKPSSEKRKPSSEKLHAVAWQIITGPLRWHTDTHMIVVTANVGLLSCPSKGQLHPARCPLHHKRESQHHVNGWKTWRNDALLIAFGSPYHSRPNGSMSEIRLTPRWSLRGRTS